MTDLPCSQRPDDWFAAPGTEQYNRAKRLCLHCPLYFQCQEYALTEGIPEGIFGGMDAPTRHRIWKRTGGRPKKFDQVIYSLTRNYTFSERKAS